MTIARIARTNPPPLPTVRNLIAIASGKGGVGKTWLAVTLAHAMARQGIKPLLFDGDLGLANVDVQLGLTPERDLGSVLAGRTSLGSVVTHVSAAGFDVIAGHSGSGGLAALRREQLRGLSEDLFELAASYDCVILDLGAGIERTVRALAAPAGVCLVVATDEPTSLTDAYAFIKLIVQDRPTVDVRIVINRAVSSTAGERTYASLVKACQNFLKISPPLAGIVRHDRRVGDCIRSQTPLISRFPQSEAAHDVEVLAQRLALAQ